MKEMLIAQDVLHEKICRGTLWMQDACDLNAEESTRIFQEFIFAHIPSDCIITEKDCDNVTIEKQHVLHSGPNVDLVQKAFRWNVM